MAGSRLKELEDDSEVVTSITGEFGVPGIVERKVADPNFPEIRRVKSAE